jgi:hypothetical protein
LFVVPAFLLAGIVSHVTEFSSSSLSFDRTDGYDVVEIAGATHFGEPGTPLLPVQTTYLLLPPDAQVTGVKVTTEEAAELPGEYNLYPTQPPSPFSTGKPPEFVPQDAAIYNSAEPYPAQTLVHYSTGIKSGFQVCGVTFSPLQYLPAEHRLRLNQRVRIDVVYEDGARAPALLTASQLDLFRKDVAALVANPEDLPAFSPLKRETDDYEIDYLVITDNGLTNALQPFCNWKTSKGIRTEMRTTQWIGTHYPGRDLPEKMRNLVIDFFNNRGLKFLLLAGDVELVPCRQARAICAGEVGNIPCDLYFGDLQGSWDGNHNDVFGEQGGDSVDLYADIYVGRAPIDNTAQAATFLNKVMTYERNPDPDYVKKLLLPSGWLWQEIGYHGHVVNDAIAALTPGDWEDASLIDPPGPTTAFDSINAGFAFCHLAGHGNQQGVYSQNGTPLYTQSQAGVQTNGFRKLCIINSMACDPGDIEWNDCIAEYAVNDPRGGAICVMMNSRYGWGTPPSMGPSELLDLSFYNYFFNFDSTFIGIDHARSKDYYHDDAMYDGCWRWCVYELNLLGDPQLPLWHGAPHSLVVVHSDSIRTGQDTLAVQVSADGSPLANAEVCAWKSNEVFAQGVTNGSGEARIPTCAAIPGSMSLVVTAPEHLPYVDSVRVVPGTQMAYLAFDSYSVDDAGQTNPNCVLEPLETVNLLVTIRNLGNLNASNVRATLHGLSSFVTILDSVSDFGTVGAGASAQGSAFRLTARASVPQNAMLDFLLDVNSDQGGWTLPFWVYVGFQGLSVADVDSCTGLLSVTAMGALGFNSQPSSKGRGFRYPQSDTSRLYLGSFLLGASPDYVADNYYGVPFSHVGNDWRMTDSLRYILPLWGSSEHVAGGYSDAGAASPRNVQVRQQSIALNRPGYSDFVIMVYDITNAGSSSLDQAYAGLLCDFNVMASDRLHDWARGSQTFRAAYMWNALTQYPTVGVKLLSADPLSNATVIDPKLYKYPDSSLSKSMKYRLLSGAISEASSDRIADWSVGVATGPVDIGPGTTRRVAFAVVGGSDTLAFVANCDSAQSWYNLHVGIEEPSGAVQMKPPAFSLVPNPCAGPLIISYQVRQTGRVSIELFDATGRKTATLLDRAMPAGSHRLSIGNLHSSFVIPQGVYFLKLRTGSETYCSKLLLVNWR